MSCVTSREVPGPAHGSAHGSALQRGGDAAEVLRRPRTVQDASAYNLVDGNGNFGDIVDAESPSLLFDCNCNVRRPLFRDMEWGYSEENGPATWHKKFPHASGQRQSPVDLCSSVARSDSSLRPLYRRHDPQTGCTLSNTGYGWKVQIAGPNTELSGGPLQSKFRLEQFHMHWGDSSKVGSEHTVDGQAYAGELHLVHWNCEKYASFSEAASKPDGLAVLGVFFKVGDTLSELQKIVELLEKVKYKGQSVAINGEVDPSKLLPSKSNYWTYLGSLTTPPCNESVIWIVFREALSISEQQLQSMRALRCYSEGDSCPCDETQGLLCKNFRPPLPLGNRELRECGE